MILTRTPLRISIGGGGTDLPSYYSRFGGFVISAGISHHIYVSVTKRFGNGYTLR
jgi:D-glycero-alpha-D-manno-heptose-7-phosphate kinase